MKSILINLIFIASTLVLVQCDRDVSECDAISEIFRYWPCENHETIVEFISRNCPTVDFIRHIVYIKLSLEEKGDLGDKHNRIDTEHKEEQAAWLKETELKVSEYYSQLADLADSKPRSVANTVKIIEYPKSTIIDSLLKEVDEDNHFTESAKEHFSLYYLDYYNGMEGVQKVMAILARVDYPDDLSYV